MKPWAPALIWMLLSHVRCTLIHCSGIRSFPNNIGKKNTQQGFEEHGKECGLQIPLISFQIDVMKNQISMET